VKGGALLLKASRFIHACEAIERKSNFPEQLNTFKSLLLKQNQLIQQHQEQQIRLNAQIDSPD
jgi:type III secretory pathway lipoprotein EscJ